MGNQDRLSLLDLGDRFGAIAVLAVETGLRLEECIALVWGNIDLRVRVIEVRRVCVDGAGPTLAFDD